MNSTANQFLRYSLIGIASNITIFLLYALLIEFGVDPFSSMSISYAMGVAGSYKFNSNWTFTKNQNNWREFFRYIGVYLSGYFINLIFLSIFMLKLNIKPLIAQAICIFLIMIWIFILQKFYVFKSESD